MNIGLVFPMELEYEGFLKALEIVPLNKNISISTVVSGIGKVNVSYNTTKFILENDFDVIVNCGVAGGLGASQQYDVYVIDKLNYSDVDVCVFGYDLGQVPDMPNVYETMQHPLIKMDNLTIKAGNVVSQDSFATNKYESFLNENFADYQVLDMESTSFAQVCYLAKKDFLVFRSISDCIFHPNGVHGYEQAKHQASINASLVMIKTLNEMFK